MHIPHPLNGIGQCHGEQSVAFAGIYNRFYNPLVYFARKLLSDPSAAEDIVTEIFLKFWEKHHHFTSLYAAKAWLHISTKNACINHNKNSQTQARAKAALHALSDTFDDSVLQAITQTEFLREVCYIVEALPVQCRKIVVLSYISGLSNQEIARLMRISVHTVRNQKVRGIQLLRGKVQQHI
jgi:RNA polymerase sigma-70 factor (ECF subfamily)